MDNDNSNPADLTGVADDDERVGLAISRGTKRAHSTMQTNIPAENDKETIAGFLRGHYEDGRKYITLGRYSTCVCYTGVVENTRDKTSLKQLKDTLVAQEKVMNLAGQAHGSLMTPKILASRKQIIAAENETFRNRILSAFTIEDKVVGEITNAIRRVYGMVTLIHASRTTLWQLYPVEGRDKNSPTLLSLNNLYEANILEKKSYVYDYPPRYSNWDAVHFSSTIADALKFLEIGSFPSEGNLYGTLYLFPPTTLEALDAKQVEDLTEEQVNDWAEAEEKEMDAEKVGKRSHFCETGLGSVKPEAVLMYFKLSNGKYYFVWIWQKDADGPFSILADFICDMNSNTTFGKHWIDQQWFHVPRQNKNMPGIPTTLEGAITKVHEVTTAIKRMDHEWRVPHSLWDTTVEFPAYTDDAVASLRKRNKELRKVVMAKNHPWPWYLYY